MSDTGFYIAKQAAEKRRRRPKAYPKLVGARRDIIIEACQFTCAYCGVHNETRGNFWEIDHIVPLSRGGLHEPANWILACGSCNQNKSNLLHWEPIYSLHLSMVVERLGVFWDWYDRMLARQSMAKLTAYYAEVPTRKGQHRDQPEVVYD